MTVETLALQVSSLEMQLQVLKAQIQQLKPQEPTKKTADLFGILPQLSVFTEEDIDNALYRLKPNFIIWRPYVLRSKCALSARNPATD